MFKSKQINYIILRVAAVSVIITFLANDLLYGLSPKLRTKEDAGFRDAATFMQVASLIGKYMHLGISNESIIKIIGNNFPESRSRGVLQYAPTMQDKLLHGWDWKKLHKLENENAYLLPIYRDDQEHPAFNYKFFIEGEIQQGDWVIPVGGKKNVYVRVERADGQESIMLRKEQARQYLTRLGADLRKIAPERFLDIPLGITPKTKLEKLREYADDRYYVRMIPKVRRLAKILKKDVGIHVMPSRKLLEVAERDFSGSVYTVIPELMRAHNVGSDSSAAREYIKQFLFQFRDVIGFGFRTRDEVPKPSVPVVLFMEPTQTAGGEDIISMRAGTYGEYFYKSDAYLSFMNKKTFEDRLHGLVQFNFEDMDNTPFEYIVRMMGEKYIDELLRIASEDILRQNREFIVELAAPNDADDIFTMFLAYHWPKMREPGTLLLEKEALELLKETADPENGLPQKIFVARCGGEVVGCVKAEAIITSPEMRSWKIEDLSVDTYFRDKRIARKLVTAAFEWIKAQQGSEDILIGDGSPHGETGKIALSLGFEDIGNKAYLYRGTMGEDGRSTQNRRAFLGMLIGAGTGLALSGKQAKGAQVELDAEKEKAYSDLINGKIKDNRKLAEKKDRADDWVNDMVRGILRDMLFDNDKAARFKQIKYVEISWVMGQRYKKVYVHVERDSKEDMPEPYFRETVFSFEEGALIKSIGRIKMTRDKSLKRFVDNIYGGDYPGLEYKKANYFKWLLYGSAWVGAAYILYSAGFKAWRAWTARRMAVKHPGEKNSGEWFSQRKCGFISSFAQHISDRLDLKISLELNGKKADASKTAEVFKLCPGRGQKIKVTAIGMTESSIEDTEALRSVEFLFNMFLEDDVALDQRDDSGTLNKRKEYYDEIDALLPREEGAFIGEFSKFTHLTRENFYSVFSEYIKNKRGSTVLSPTEESELRSFERLFPDLEKARNDAEVFLEFPLGPCVIAARQTYDLLCTDGNIFNPSLIIRDLRVTSEYLKTHYYVECTVAGEKFIVDLAADVFRPINDRSRAWEREKYEDLGIVMIPKSVVNESKKKFWMYNLGSFKTEKNGQGLAKNKPINPPPKTHNIGLSADSVPYSELKFDTKYDGLYFDYSDDIRHYIAVSESAHPCIKYARLKKSSYKDSLYDILKDALTFLYLEMESSAYLTSLGDTHVSLFFDGLKRHKGMSVRVAENLPQNSCIYEHDEEGIGKHNELILSKRFIEKLIFDFEEAKNLWKSAKTKELSEELIMDQIATTCVLAERLNHELSHSAVFRDIDSENAEECECVFMDYVFLKYILHAKDKYRHKYKKELVERVKSYTKFMQDPMRSRTYYRFLHDLLPLDENDVRARIKQYVQGNLVKPGTRIKTFPQAGPKRGSIKPGLSKLLTLEEGIISILEDEIKCITIQEKGRPLVLALGTDWIKEKICPEWKTLKKNSQEYEELHKMIIKLRHYFKSRSVVFIDKDDDELTDAINAELSALGTENLKIIVLAKPETLMGKDIQAIKDSKGAYLMGVDASSIKPKNYIRLVEMLVLTLDYAAGVYLYRDNKNIDFRLDEKTGLPILMPRAEAIDWTVEDLKRVYGRLAEKFA